MKTYIGKFKYDNKIHEVDFTHAEALPLTHTLIFPVVKNYEPEEAVLHLWSYYYDSVGVSFKLAFTEELNNKIVGYYDQVS